MDSGAVASGLRDTLFSGMEPLIKIGLGLMALWFCVIELAKLYKVLPYWGLGPAPRELSWTKRGARETVRYDAKGWTVIDRKAKTATRYDYDFGRGGKGGTKVRDVTAEHKGYFEKAERLAELRRQQEAVRAGRS